MPIGSVLEDGRQAPCVQLSYDPCLQCAVGPILEVMHATDDMLDPEAR